MEKKDIDIYEILKDMPDGTSLYTPMVGKVELTYVATNKEEGEAIWTENRNGEFSFDKNGRWMKGGEVLLFPSKEMRDWSRFFKKGDVLESDNKLKRCIFEEWANDDYTNFNCFAMDEGWNDYFSKINNSTFEYHKADDFVTELHIKRVEKKFGGKLNLQTLEIEKPEFKDGDIVVYGKSVAICRNIYKNILSFYVSLNEMFGLLFSDVVESSEEYRFATEEEKQQLFSALEKEGKRWDSEKKQIVDLKPAFEIGKLYVFKEEDEDGELTIIGKLIDKNESEDTLTFGNQYEIETEKFVTDQAFDLRISVNKELREATENEIELFNKHYSIWKKEKEAKEKPAFKTFDKVLVRDGRGFKWIPALFVRDRGEGANYRYEALSIQSGKTSGFSICIPYEGHENFAFTDYDFVDLPF